VSFVRVKIRGVDKMANNLKRFEQQITQHCKDALYEESLENIIKPSQAQTPVDTGALRSSGYTNRPEEKGSLIYTNCGFGTDDIINPKTGEPTSAYAVKVHEDLTAFHRVGKAKFLEDVVVLRKNEFANNIGRGLTRRLGR